MSATSIQGMMFGAKGSDVYTDGGVGDPRVALNTKLVRGARPEDVVAGVMAILALGTDEALKDAVVMAFQVRDVRGGKGERKLFRQMLDGLAQEKPELVLALLDLVPEYGSWDDIFTLANEALERGHVPLLDALLKVAVEQLKKDEAAVRQWRSADASFPTPLKPSISLCAKWAPREGKQFGKLAMYMATRLGGDAAQSFKHSQQMASYRKRLSALNQFLDTVEVKECSKHWADIDPKHVPARAREIKKAAYLNEKMRKEGARGAAEPRHPDDPDRVACREHFQAFFKAAAEGKVTISGSQTLYPHEVVYKAERATTEEDRNSLNPVWKEMVKKAGEGGGLGKSVFMCDFSGSMESSALGDLPMRVSKAMGLLGCAVCSGPFKGRFLTFNTVPEWCEIDPDQPLTEQVQQFNMNWGGTTDFQAAGEKIIAELKKARAPPGSAPENLIVVTDMGFDQACSSIGPYRHNVKSAAEQTHAQMLREAFRRASEDVHGDPNAWAPPRIVIWNVAAQYSDNHQARADEEGVLTLSGWSPSLFKVLCEEGPRAITPMEVLRLMLDAKRYDPVRQRVDEWLAGGWRGI